MLKTLKARAAVATTALTGVALLTLTAMFAQAMDDAVMHQVRERQAALLGRVAAQVDGQLARARGTLSALSSDLVLDGDPEVGTGVQQALRRPLGLLAEFSDVAVYRPDGRVLAQRGAGAPDLGVQPWFHDALRRPRIGPVDAVGAGRASIRPAVPMAYPVVDAAGRPTAVVVGWLSLGDPGWFIGRDDAGVGTEYLVVDGARRVVLHSQGRHLLSPLDALGPAGHDLLETVGAGAGHRVVQAADGRRWLHSVTALSHEGWMLVGRLDLGPTRAARADAVRQVALGGVGLLMLLLPSVWLLMEALLAPLARLRAEIRDLRDGRAVAPAAGRRGAVPVAAELQQVIDEFEAMAVARTGVEQALQQERDRARVTLQSIHDAVIVTDAAGRVTDLNLAAERLLGLDRDQVLDRPVGDVAPLVDEADGTLRHDLLGGPSRPDGAAGGAALLHNALGVALAVEPSVAPVRGARGDGRGDGAVIVLRDVAAQREATRELHWRANHDALTGLANRRAFEAALAHVLAADDRGGQRHTLLMMDLDRFKIVNDTGGHAAGDELLRELAGLLRQRTRQSDLVARLGGDEFAVLMYGCPADKGLTIATGLCRAVEAWRFVHEARVYQVGISIGVLQIDGQDADTGAVQKAADAACYLAKRAGGNRAWLHLPDSADARAVSEQSWRAHEVQSAIERGRLRLHAQVIVPAAPTGARLCFEVLLRMVDDAGALVMPDQFLPAAERFGLMDRVDRWVLQEAVAACARRAARSGWDWLDSASVNVSALSLREEGLAEFVAGLLARHAMPPRALCIEVTETAALDSLGTARRVLQRLRQQGVRIALDDFGVGMNSLSRLRELPVDALKIDGSFIEGIERDPLNGDIVASIQRIAERLGLRTVAERVETAAQAQCLRALGISHLQGFLYARPLPIDTVLAAPEPAPVESSVTTGA